MTLLAAALLGLVYLGGWRLAARWTQGGRLHHLLLTLLLGPALLLVALHLCGALGLLSRWPLVLCTAVLGAAACGLGTAAPRRAPLSIRWSDPSTWPVALALMVAVLSCWIVWRLPTWSWDCVWYHLPMTYYALQTGSTAWVDTHVPYVNGYPRAVELLAAWAVAITGDSRWDDASQLLVAPLGAAAVMAWARRFGASVELALGAGAAWLCLPAVFLQLHTTHADVAAGSFFLAALYFLCATPFDRPARLGTALALALYASTKNLGLFHLALLLPVLAFRLARARPRWTEVALLAALLVAGSHTFLRNAMRTGNPLWPARVEVPLLGVTLPGELDEARIAGPPAFFRGEGAVTRMVRGWFLRSQNYFPDVREGPFGVVFPYLLLPALLAFLAWLAWRRRVADLSWVALAIAVTVVVPAAWWGRFVLALPGVALAALAALQAQVPRPARHGLAVLLLALSAEGVRHAWPGYRVLPALTESAQQSERRLRAAIGWLWSPDMVALRERELGEGAVVAHDPSIAFLGELWNARVTNRVVHVAPGPDWLVRMEATGARWFAAGSTTEAAREALARPDRYQPLFPVPGAQALMFRVLR